VSLLAAALLAVGVYLGRQEIFGTVGAAHQARAPAWPPPLGLLGEPVSAGNPAATGRDDERRALGPTLLGARAGTAATDGTPQPAPAPETAGSPHPAGQEARAPALPSERTGQPAGARPAGDGSGSGGSRSEEPGSEELGSEELAAPGPPGGDAGTDRAGGEDSSHDAASSLAAASDGPGSDRTGGEGAGGEEPAGEEPARDESASEDSSAGSPPAPATEQHAAPGSQVTIVPGMPRYHRRECILIRFLADEDLETMSLRAAEDSGCVPCKACQPGTLPGLPRATVAVAPLLPRYVER
jgi:hypothetical protein